MKNTSKKALKETKLYIQGMHCGSCEVLIEKAILEKDGVQFADASMSTGEVRIQHMQDAKISARELNASLKDLGYTFSHNKKEEKRQPHSVVFYLAILASLLVLFYGFDKIQFGQYMQIDASSSLAAFVVLGLVASMSSCAALVGGIILSLSKNWNEKYAADTFAQRFAPHTLFHLGRIGTFIVLGGVLGFLGKSITLESVTLYAVLIVIVSLIMIVLSLQMLGFSWAQKLQFRLPKKFAALASGGSTMHTYTPFLIGAGTFFLPCGFTLIAQGVALISGSFFLGALIMGAFAFGTAPVLMTLSASGVYFNSKPDWSKRFNIVAGILVLFFGLYNINAQMNVLGLPSFSGSVEQEEMSTENTQQEIQPGEMQELKIIARDFSYIPEGSMTLQAGVPTKLIVTNDNSVGCAQFMAARGLFPGYLDLTKGDASIEFTPKKGTYKLTCTMGMVKPVTIRVE